MLSDNTNSSEVDGHQHQYRVTAISWIYVCRKEYIWYLEMLWHSNFIDKQFFFLNIPPLGNVQCGPYSLSQNADYNSIFLLFEGPCQIRVHPTKNIRISGLTHHPEYAAARYHLLPIDAPYIWSGVMVFKSGISKVRGFDCTSIIQAFSY